MMLALAKPSVEEQYAAAFRRRWPDVDIDRQPASEVAARLREEPEAVLRGGHCRPGSLDGGAAAAEASREEWRRLLEVVERLDHSEQRRQLRALLAGGGRPRAENVVGLLDLRPPWRALWELGRGSLWRRLRQLRARMNAADEPVLTVLLLAQTSSGVGDLAGAEAVLRQALARRPDEVALLYALGTVLAQQGPSRLSEVIGCCRAVRASHPQLGVALGRRWR